MIVLPWLTLREQREPAFRTLHVMTLQVITLFRIIKTRLLHACISSLGIYLNAGWIDSYQNEADTTR